MSQGGASGGKMHMADRARIKLGLILGWVIMMALVMAPLASAAAEQPPDAMAQMKSLGDQILDMTRSPACKNNPEECREKLRKIIEQHWDKTEMARSALGVHWRQLTPAQRKEFTSLFAQLTEAIYLNRSNFSKAQSYADTINVKYIREFSEGDGYSQINTTIALHPGEQPIKVDYRVRLVDGNWKVYDVVVDNISLVGNYRNQFNRIINNRGYADLVSALKRKIKELDQSQKT